MPTDNKTPLIRAKENLVSRHWRSTREYRTWRIAVIRRDKRCVICNSLKNRQAHHINHAMYFPDKRFEVENGITLCKSCHTQFHTNFKRSYRTKCTSYDFENFKTLVKYIKRLVNVAL